MKRIKAYVLRLCDLIALLALLGAWIVLPWMALLAIGAVVLVLLAFTRLGRLAGAFAWLGISSIPMRWGSATVVVMGTAAVVGVMVAILAMANGFESMMNRTGSEKSAIILRQGVISETSSALTLEQMQLALQLPGIAKDEQGNPIASAEFGQMLSMSLDPGSDASVYVRGIEPAAWKLRPTAKIVAGRSFRPGTYEILVGASAMRKFGALSIGSSVNISNQQWTVVGAFSTGDSFDSEIWTDVHALMSANHRTSVQSITVGLVDPVKSLEALQVGLQSDKRLKLDAMTTRDYYRKQSERLVQIMSTMGVFVAAIMAAGAVCGAFNAMSAAISGRAREIAALRAIGFRGLPVILGLMAETLLLAALGGGLGAGLAWLGFNGYTVSTLGGNFSQVMFQFHVTSDIMVEGMKWALGIGLIGGLIPSTGAVRQPVMSALRTL